MGWVKWGLRAFLLLLVAGFLHYTLPQHDIVRIVNTYEERQELGDWTRIFWTTPDSQPATQTSRDVQFIQAITPDGERHGLSQRRHGLALAPVFQIRHSHALYRGKRCHLDQGRARMGGGYALWVAQ